jgi:iron(III) transport system substrate-binding protein
VRLSSLLVVLLLAACDARPPSPPLVVFVAGVEQDRLVQMLDEFSAESGMSLTVRTGASADLTDRLINGSAEHADILITDDVADALRAAERGALRPLQSDVAGAMHPSLRDPDGLWIAFEIWPRWIQHFSDVRPINPTYEDLGTDAFSGRLCLSSASLPGNRALLAHLIEAHDVLNVERLVRRWVRNLAQPPYATDAELRDAVRSGVCDYAIVSTAYPLAGNWRLASGPYSYDATAIGIGRHAAQPELAHEFVDWVLENKAVSIPGNAELPAAAVAGWRDEEARLLAERAGYR